MPLQVPVTQTGLEASIEAAAKKAGRNLRIDLGTNAKSINALSQPLGRITGQADEFTKSMEAANARVFAFGASVGIINGVTKAFSSLVKNTIEVEKSLVEINTVLNASGDSLQKFGNKLFDVAKTTGQTFDVVAKGALELARQGLSTEETLKRINDALILSRLSGLDAQQSVEGLTAAFNSFKETGITTSQILNKLVVVSQKYSVSERDLIEGLKRSASVADQAGVSFDELVGIITTVQERTARGGAVIGNAFKTIFARIQDTGALQDLANLGIQVTDLEGKVLPATKILQNLGAEFNNLSQLEQADIAKKLGGVYQLSNLLAAVKDLSSEQSKYNDIVKLSAGATNEAYQKNAALNETLASLINKVSVSAQQLGATLGAIGITDNLKSLLAFFNNILEGIQNILGEESALGTFVKGLAKGIGNVLAGPGLALFGGIIAKLSKDLIGFGIESLKSFFKIGQAAKDIERLQGSIASTLLKNKDIQAQILSLEGNRVAQTKFFTAALNEQYSVMQKMQGIAASVAPMVYTGTSGSRGGKAKNSAGGYMPAVSQESRNISRGVGGAKAGDKPVVIPNFAFGGGKKGTMVAHTGEFIVPNFAAGGSAIFNRDMVRSMGLPAGAKKIGAAGGFIPNFAEWYNRDTTKVKTSTSMPTTPGDWIKVKSSSESIRKYSENIDQYRVRDTDFYLFPDGTGSRGNTVRDTLSREESKAVTNIKQQKQKISEAGEFEINANALGGIAVVSPRFGSGVRELSATGLIANYAAFNQGGPNANIDKNKYITLKGIKGVNTPKPQDVKGLSVDINQLFADRIVDLAYKLYGGTFDSASAGEFGQKLKSLSGKRALLPPTAEGQIFEAAGKVALNSIENLESLFGSEEQNRPFDFQNPKAIQQMFGLNVLRGDAKRGGEDKFVDKDGKMAVSSKGQDMIRKSLNDPEYSYKMLSILKSQGAFSPEMQRKKSNEEISNAINGFIPNFSKRVPEKIRAGRDFESDVFAKLKLGNPGNRTLDIPEGLLTRQRIEEAKTSMGLQGSFGDVKLSNAKTNKYNFLGKLIKYFNLANYVTSAFKDKGQKEVSLNKKIPSISDATMFFSGNPSLYYPEEVSATLGQILHESRGLDGVQSPVLEAFKSARAKPGDPSSVALQDAFKRKKIIAKINMDGINPYQNTLNDKDPFAKGYIPNFVSQKYVMDTLARIKAGTSGFSKQEQETFLNKFGAKSTGRKISLREVYDKLDGDVGISALIDKAYMAAGPTASNEDVYRIFEKQIKANPYALRGLVSKKGFVPNFADPLKEAISREMSAGVPASQIYVDQNSSLKNSMNPMGLMVANRRDEPGGGMQGINRARKEGANPMMYGAASGFIPNYAESLSSSVSKQTGVKINAGPAQQAIDDFAKEASKAGADMKKLTAELSKKLASITQENVISKQLATAAQAEVSQRQQAAATRILESNAGKKLAAQLDKIYLEYNKSQKTTQDLQNAQAKATAVLNQSNKLSQANRTAIVNSTAPLASNRQSAQVDAAGSRDLLGTIFAVQTGLSFLVGAFDNAGSSFSAAASAMTSVASSATSVYLLFKGFEGIGGKFGSLAGKLGIYGAAAAGLYEGFKLVAKNLDSTNASINNASFAMENFAKVAAGATVNFGTLTKSQQEKISSTRENLIEGAKRYEKTTYDAKGDLKSRALMQASFEGYSGELKTQFDGAIDQALAVGVSFDLIFNRLRKAAESQNKVTSEEIENMVGEFKTLAEEIAKVKPIDFIKNAGIFEGGKNAEFAKKFQNYTSDQLEEQLKLFNEKGTGKGTTQLQELITQYTPIRGKTAQQEFARLAQQERKGAIKAQEENIKIATETASLSLLKQQLENKIAYKNALFEATSAEEYSLELQKEMLSVGEKDRVAAGYKLQALQEAKKLTLEQEKATLDVLKNSELINKKLEGAGLGGTIDPTKFKEIAGISEEISDLIKQQGGYTNVVANKTAELVGELGLSEKQQQLILDTIKETNGEISKRLALENKINALNNLRAAQIEASKFVNEKQTAAITNEYDQQLKLNELKKRGYDIDLETFKIQSERKKIGGSAGSSFAIDRKIKEQEQLTLKVKFDLDQQDLLIQVKKTLAEAALSAGLSTQEVKDLNLNQVTTPEQAKEKAKAIAVIEGEAEIKKLLTAQAQFEKSAAASDYFTNQVVFSADEFARKIISIFPGDLQGKTPGALAGPEEVGKYVGQGNIPVGDNILPPTIVKANEDLKRAKSETDAQVAAIKARIAQGSALGDTIANMFAEGPLAAEEYKNKLAELDNAFASSGASLTTFNNLVRGVFTNLSENIAQNQFAMLSATDSQSIIGNAVEARKNAILAQGPSDKGTIIAAADSTAIYEKELEIKRAITAEDKINGEFELEKLKEILPLRMELLKAETNSEREAIIDRIIAKEKQRLPVLDRIKAAMTSTPEQRTQELEDSLVNASVQFRDNLIDGVSKAIEEGGSLGDVLRSAALDFARSMTQAGLKNVTSQIGGLFGFAKGGLVPNMASGGMINGGSGSKDDVPAMLMGGEYVLKKTAVQKYGPDFLDALNNGRLGGYAKGGKVNEIPNQTGAGGFFASGLYDTGSIVGKEDLLRFATQSYTSGARDVITSGENFASVNLEAESLRLTNFGRTNDRMFQATQSAKEEAFGLYGQQVQQEIDYKKQLEEYEKQKAAQRKAEKKALRNQLIMMAVSAFAGPVLGAAGAGFKAAFGAAGGMQNFLPAVGSGLKGIFTGGSVGGVNVGGLGNLFKGVGQGLTGNFSGAGNSFKLSQIGTSEQLQGAFNKSVASGSGFSGFLEKSGYIPKASVVNEGGVGINGGGGGGGIFDWFNKIKSGVGGLFGGGRDIDAKGFEYTGEDIKDPTQWIRGGGSTAYDYGVLPPLDTADPNALPLLYPEYSNKPIKYDGPPSSRRRATGGTIPSTTGVDTVPAMLSGGEFIMNRAASQNIGAGNLQSLNAGASSLPTEEKTEELNDRLISKLDELIEATSGGGDITINVEAGSGKTSEEGGNEENEKRVQMARLIKDMVLKVIQDEKRLGGALRRG